MDRRWAAIWRQRRWWAPAGGLLLLLFSIAGGSWRATATGPQVQVPMFYDDHYVYPRAWTQAQEAPGVPAPFPLALYGPNSASQQFVSAADNLALIEVWLAGPPPTTVRATLVDSAGPVYGASFTLAQGTEGGWYRLTFPPIADAAGRAFRLTLQAPQATRAAPAVSAAVGGDRLQRGLALNEFLRPGNLVLRTYARGAPGGWWLQALGEQLLPAAFRLRLQQYRPPLFKGNTFALLLTVSLLLTALLLFAARPGGPSRGALAGWLAALPLLFLAWQLGGGRLLLGAGGNAVALQPAAPPMADLTVDEPRQTHDLISLLWTAERRPEERFVGTTAAPLPALTVPGDSEIRYALDLPRNPRLLGSVAADGAGALVFTVSFNGSLLFEETLAGGAAPRPLDLDLGPWQGQGGTLTLATRAVSGTPQGRWVMPQLLALTDWVLPALPADRPATPLGARFGEAITLAAYDLDLTGETLTVTLYWQTDRPLVAPLKVFVHARDAAGAIVTQSDGQPVANSYPTPAWIPGTVIVDTHVLAWPAGASAPPAGLAVGLYEPDTLQRLPAVDAAGAPLPDGQLLLPGP